MWAVEVTDQFIEWWLRAAKGGALRVLFSFDPRRHAILLLGGDKSGEWNDWYAWAIPLADDLSDEYLRELGDSRGQVARDR